MDPQTPDPQGPTPNPAPAPVPPAVPVAPKPQPATASGHVDLDKIILPKKPGAASADSAQRINAGILFEQERTATLPEPEKPAVSAAPQPPKPEPLLVKPLQTYQGDIESLVGDKQISVVNIAAAEATRRGTKPIEAAQAPLNQLASRAWLRTAGMVAGGIVLLAVAVGIGWYIFMRSQPVPLAKQAPAPFILVDDTATVAFQPGDLRSEIMRALGAAKNKITLSLGLVARLQIAKPTPLNDGSLQEVGAPEFLQALAPSIPPALVRTLEPQMLLGVHSFDENQMFMILKVDSYETAYSGMLAWETSMRGDLSPLFTRTPAVRAAAPAPAGTTTASSTPPAQEPAPVQFFGGNFIDQIVENHDARVVLNPDGDILLLWTFLDRSTIVITTNELTLREVISRLSQASIQSLPTGQ